MRPDGHHSAPLEPHSDVGAGFALALLAAEVIQATLREAGVRGFVLSTQRLERHLAHLPAREIQQATQEALAKAVWAGRKRLEWRDLHEHVLDGEAKSSEGPSHLH